MWLLLLLNTTTTTGTTRTRRRQQKQQVIHYASSVVSVLIVFLFLFSSRCSGVDGSSFLWSSSSLSVKTTTPTRQQQNRIKQQHQKQIIRMLHSSLSSSSSGPVPFRKSIRHRSSIVVSSRTTDRSATGSSDHDDSDTRQGGGSAGNESASASTSAVLDVELRYLSRTMYDDEECYTHVIGSDDAGTGAIAGPIVTASVCVLPTTTTTSCDDSKYEDDDDNFYEDYNPILHINDRKKISNRRRRSIYNHVTNHPERYVWSYSIRTSQQINDLHNQQQQQEGASNNKNKKLQGHQRKQQQRNSSRRRKGAKSGGNSSKGGGGGNNEGVAAVIHSSVMDCFRESITSVHDQLVTKLEGEEDDEDEDDASRRASSRHSVVSSYSIVDGHRSPHFSRQNNNNKMMMDDNNDENDNDHNVAPTSRNIISRPWIRGDSIVYSVALASIMARVVCEDIMKNNVMEYYQSQQRDKEYDNNNNSNNNNIDDPYEFHQNYGYGNHKHFIALQRYGPTPLHRQCCKPVYKAQLLANANALQSQMQQHLQRKQSKQEDDDNDNDDDYEGQQQRPSSAFTQDDDSNPQPQSRKKSMLSSSSSSSSRLFLFSRNDIVKRLLPRFLLLGTTTIATSTPFGGSPSAGIFAPGLPVSATTLDKRTGVLYPDIGEIERSIPLEWTSDDVDDIIETKASYTRLDEIDDAIFYKEPRFVEHIDEQAVQLLTKYIDNFIMKTVKAKATETTEPLAILDLCSSWTSHISKSVIDNISPSPRIVGLGMNKEELSSNPVLAEWIVQDLNQNPILPYNDNTFDIVLCQLSIDYLTKPLTVCNEVGRILRKRSGTFHVIYSNRSFIQKAVGIWTGKDDIDHTYTIASYLHYAKEQPFDDTTIHAIDLSIRQGQGRNNNYNNNRKGGAGVVVGDPLYVVVASKK